MAEEAQGPWQGYKLYKIFHSDENRWYVRLISETNKENTKTTSYARYLMEVKTNRILEDHETVDHINNDKTDDRVENLQILSLKENIKKSTPLAATVELICSNCNKSFIRRKNQTSKYKSDRSYCSRNCTYEYFSKNKICVSNSYEIKKKEIKHGTKTAYSYHGCRCDLCKKASTEASRKRREKNKLKGS